MKLSLTLLLLPLSILTASCSSTTPATPTPASAPRAESPVVVRVVALNDLHGHMEGPTGSVKIGGEKAEAGGLDMMGTHLAALRAQNPNTAFVCAGDLVGASPLLSGLFHDEPTVEAMNLLQMDAVAVGNHEFDEGTQELLRLQRGGCHKEEGCVGKAAFEGASFPFLAANVTQKADGKPLFPGHLVKEYGEVKVGFIGLTFKDTPTAVSPEGVKDVSFGDEVEAINREVGLLKAQGVHAIVVVIHQGGYPEAESNDLNDCPGISGPLVEINKRIDPAVDAVVSGHTHQAYNCVLEGRPVTSAQSYGRILTVIDLTIDPATNEVIKSEAKNVAVTRDVAPDATMSAHIARYRQLIGPLATKQVARVSADILRAPDPAGNSLLGQLIADAQLAATAPLEAGGAQLALMNLGGVRADVLLAPGAGEEEGVVTYEEMHQVQPFGNTLVVLEMTGAQLKTLLESQWQGERVHMLQPSRGLTYRWDKAGGQGERVALESVKVGGNPLELDAVYRVTVNSFLASGGDGFEVFKDAKQVAAGPLDLDAFVTWAQTQTPLVAGTPRITAE